MNWKTDWGPSDNYARSGASDVERLLSNYESLKQTLNADFGFNIVFATPATDGYATIPHADFLNSVESALSAIHAWTVEWEEKIVTWTAAGSLPTYEDVNRWERNGYAIEEASEAAKRILVRCGAAICGSVLYLVN